MVKSKSDGNGGTKTVIDRAESIKMVVYVLTIILTAFILYNMTVGDLKSAVMSNTLTIKTIGAEVANQERCLRTLEREVWEHHAAHSKKDNGK